MPFKFQIAALLQMGGGRADSSQRERLEQSLEQSRSEVHMLTEKIKMLEKAKVHWVRLMGISIWVYSGNESKEVLNTARTKVSRPGGTSKEKAIKKMSWFSYKRVV